MLFYLFLPIIILPHLIDAISLSSPIKSQDRLIRQSAKEDNTPSAQIIASVQENVTHARNDPVRNFQLNVSKSIFRTATHWRTNTQKSASHFLRLRFLQRPKHFARHSLPAVKLNWKLTFSPISSNFSFHEFYEQFLPREIVIDFSGYCKLHRERFQYVCPDPIRFHTYAQDVSLKIQSSQNPYE